MSNLRGLFENAAQINEAATPINKILDKAIAAINKLPTVTVPSDVAAFIEWADQQGMTYKGAEKEMENLGSYSFQNSADELWDEYAEKGDDFYGITWGDLQDVSASEASSWSKKSAKSVSDTDKQTAISQLEGMK